MGRARIIDRKFYNRDCEVKLAEDYLKIKANDNRAALIFTSDDSYGATSLLKKLSQKFQQPESNHEKYRVLCISLNCEDPSLDGFLKSFFFNLNDQKPKMAHKIISEVDKIGTPGREEKLGRSLIAAVPYAGKAFVHARQLSQTNISSAYKIRTSPNKILHVAAEALVNYKTILFIDNLHLLNPNQTDFLRSILFHFSDTNIKIVGHYRKPLSKKHAVLFRELLGKLKLHPLKPLSFEILSEMASDIRSNANLNDLREITKSSQSIYDVLDFIHEFDSSENKSFEPLTPIQSYIISILELWKKPIQENLLFKCLSSSKLIAFNGEQDLFKAVKGLVSEKILRSFEFDDTEFVVLSTSFNRLRNDELNDLDFIAFASEIYDFTRKEIEVNPSFQNISGYSIAFRLALIIDRQNCNKWAALVLKNGFIEGRVEGYFDLFIDKIDIHSDFESLIFVLLSHLQQKQFKKIDDLVDSLNPATRLRDEIIALHAISMNRQRRYSESMKAIQALRKKPISSTISTQASAYEIINLFHTGKRLEAKKLFQEVRPMDSNSPSELYLLRIGAGVLPVDEGLSLLKKVLPKFKEIGDDFGYYTTKANLGTYLFKSGEHEEGAAILESAYEALIPFGPNHITHAALSLLTIKSISGNLFESRALLKKIERAPEDNHYLTAAKMIHAMTMAIAGDVRGGFNLLEEINEDVRSTPTWNIKTRYFINKALLEGIMTSSNSRMGSTLDEILKFSPKSGDRRWNGTYNLIRRSMEENRTIPEELLSKHYARSFYEYWWFLPTDLRAQT